VSVVTILMHGSDQRNQLIACSETVGG